MVKASASWLWLLPSLAAACGTCLASSQVKQLLCSRSTLDTTCRTVSRGTGSILANLFRTKSQACVHVGSLTASGKFSAFTEPNRFCSSKLPEARGLHKQNRFKIQFVKTISTALHSAKIRNITRQILAQCAEQCLPAADAKPAATPAAGGPPGLTFQSPACEPGCPGSQTAQLPVEV